MTANPARKATCDFHGCTVFEWIDKGVPAEQVLRELGWWVGKSWDPLLFCPQHYRQDVPMPAVGIYPHCVHCRPCRSEDLRTLHYRPCRYDIKCVGASPA